MQMFKKIELSSGKKTSRDLVCLARFDVNQVYFGVKWHPKFKSPSRHCFAIKHPQIQVGAMNSCRLALKPI